MFLVPWLISQANTQGNSTRGQEEHRSAGKFIIPYNFATVDATPNPRCSLQVRYVRLMPFHYYFAKIHFALLAQ